MSRSAAFTLIELIIVIALIGILAALAIPQFLGSTDDANASSLNANLIVLSDAIERYYHEHNQTYPGYDEGEGEGDEQIFIHQLTQYSNRDGDATSTLDRTNYPYGPYIHKIPENPVASDGVNPDGVRVTDLLTPLVAQETPLDAWLYSYRTGELISNIAE